jgi:uncharacterized SAM-binding protein YcdF (DUF218 family)
MDSFLAKKMLSRFFFPVPMCLEILLVGLFLLWFTRKQLLGKTVVTVGTVLLLLLSYDAFSDRLLGRLECRYRPFDQQGASAPRGRTRDLPVRWIVVLGAGHTTDPKVPLSNRPNHATLVRLLEGIRLYRENPGSQLILSGGAVNGVISSAQIMAEVAGTLGVPIRDMVLEEQSWDTEDEARLIKPLVKQDAIILVTSASHMPRSVRLFESYGMEPLPAPTDYLVTETDSCLPDGCFPGPDGLLKATRAVYEYLGLAWLKLRGVI